MAVLVIAEHDNQQLKYPTLTTLTAALQLSKDVAVLVAGYQCKTVAEQICALPGISQVLWVDAPYYQHELAEDLALLVQDVVQEKASAVVPDIHFSHILAPASTFGKNILPRVAAFLGVGQISEVIKILDPESFQRPIYAGNAITTVQSLDAIKVITIRSTAFEPLVPDPGASGHTAAPIHTLSPSTQSNHSKFIELKQESQRGPDLSSAKIVISGGRGLQSRENFKMLEALADKLDAAIGASRAAVDAGFVPNDYQVGQTGKVVAPELYIAVGISGAIQHISGMKESKVIVAINKDKDAPIFQVADYGLVGDLFQIIPDLTQEYQTRKSKKP